MAKFPNARHRTALAALCLHLALVGAFNMVTAQVPPPPPQLELLRATTTGRTVSTTVITVAAIVVFVLVLFCVLVNEWRSSSTDDADDSARGWQSSIRRRRRGLDPEAVSALPVVPYAEIRKHKSGGGVLECAVCLAVFDDGDELRLLPQCSHAFHPDCIDPWLEDHVTCPLCRTNLEEPVPVPPAAASLSSPETKPPETLEAVVTVRVVEMESDYERREETVGLEKLRAARMPRSRSTGHSASATVAAPETGADRERFTVRLPPHVLEEVLKSRRLRHATSLVIRIGGGASNCEGSSACVERCHGARRRWPSLLARTTTSWAQSVAEGSARRGGVEPDAGTRKPPCGRVVCSMAARWPARCKASNLD